MVERTSTGNAPWTLVEANDKNYARVKILRTLCERVEAELEGRVHGVLASSKKALKTSRKAPKGTATADASAAQVSEKPKRKGKDKTKGKNKPKD
jgi:hypothetical protein